MLVPTLHGVASPSQLTCKQSLDALRLRAVGERVVLLVQVTPQPNHPPVDVVLAFTGCTVASADRLVLLEPLSRRLARLPDVQNPPPPRVDRLDDVDVVVSGRRLHPYPTCVVRRGPVEPES